MRGLEILRTEVDGTPHPVQRVRYIWALFSFEVTFLNYVKILVPVEQVDSAVDMGKYFDPTEGHYWAAEDYALAHGQQYFYDYRLRALEKQQARAIADDIDAQAVAFIHDEDRPQDSPTI